ncbi:hypothetical protein B0H13DRAFT_1869697 [Mycena leptocephala]|nr:hypothetical protein B0H13DRAFT_1869697 [Mycena leptocephala]
MLCCRGKTNGEACECEAYDEPQDPSVASKCREWECGHRKNKHGSPKAVQLEVKKSTVFDVFAAQAEKTINNILPLEARLTNFNVAGVTLSKVFDLLPTRRMTGDDKEPLRLRSPRSPSVVDVANTALHGCVAEHVQIDPDWTHVDCTNTFAKLFPKALEFARQQTKNADGTLWLAAKGADLIKYKTDKKSGANGLSLYIAIIKTVPDDVYRSWFTGPKNVHPGSDDSEEGGDEVDDESGAELLGSSDDNPAQNLDAEDVPEVEALPGRYRTRPQPIPSMKKRQSMDSEMVYDSDTERIPVKKRKLGKSHSFNSGKSHTMRTASAGSSSSARQSNPFAHRDGHASVSSQLGLGKRLYLPRLSINIRASTSFFETGLHGGRLLTLNLDQGYLVSLLPKSFTAPDLRYTQVKPTMGRRSHGSLSQYLY